MQPGSLEEQGQRRSIGLVVDPRQQQGIRLVQRPLLGEKRAERLAGGARAPLSQAPQDGLGLGTAVILLGQQAGQLQPEGLQVQTLGCRLTIKSRPQPLQQQRQLVAVQLLATEGNQTFEAAHIVGSLLQKTATSRLCLVELAQLLQHLGQRPRDRDARRTVLQRLLAQNQALGQLGSLAERLQTLNQHSHRRPLGLKREGRGESGLGLGCLAHLLRGLGDAQVGLGRHSRRARRTSEQLAILTLALIPLPDAPKQTGQA